MPKAAAPAVDFFANVNVATNNSKTAKPSTPMVETKGLINYGAVDYMIKALTGIQTTLKGEIHAQMAPVFVERGLAKGGRPDNYKGREVQKDEKGTPVQGGYDVTSSLELKKRSTLSVLKDEEKALCDAHGITVEEKLTFSINEDYVNAEMLGRVKAALNDYNAKNPDKQIPADFFQGKKVYLATESSLSEIFKKGKKVAEELLRVVGVLSVKPVFHGNFDEAALLVSDLLKNQNPAAIKDEGPDLMEKLRQSVEQNKAKGKKVAK